MNEYIFQVAGFAFSVQLPVGKDVETLLPSFRPFRRNDGVPEPPIFRFRAVASLPETGGDCEEWEVGDNDMGHVRLLHQAGGYIIEISFADNGILHVMHASSDFTEAEAAVDWNDPYAGHVLNSLLRLVYAQAVTAYGAISIHASTVYREGRAYLFMGKSGTGKSTHAALWLKHIPGTGLLNDDNPTIRLCDDGIVRAYGTPWSGKTPCYRDLAFPVAGMVRLRQASANSFIPRSGVEAFVTLLPGCSVIRRDKKMLDNMCRTLTSITETVKVGELECLPDEDAARICLEELNRKDTNK